MQFWWSKVKKVSKKWHIFGNFCPLRRHFVTQVETWFRKFRHLVSQFRQSGDIGNPGKFTFSPKWPKVRFLGFPESPESPKWRKCEKKGQNSVHISHLQKKCFFQRAKNNSPNARRNWILATFLPKGIPEELKKIRPHMRLFWGKKHLQFSTAPILRYLSLTAVYRGHPESEVPGCQIWPISYEKRCQNMP